MAIKEMGKNIRVSSQCMSFIGLSEYTDTGKIIIKQKKTHSGNEIKGKKYGSERSQWGVVCWFCQL